MLASLRTLPPDPLFGLLATFDADPSPAKIDLIIGIYRDDAGRTPVMEVVQLAEQRLAAQARSKAYRALAGNLQFNDGIARLLLGQNSSQLDRQYTMQTVGGTGALRLMGDFIASTAPGARIWISTPGYINHRPIFERAGLEVCSYSWREGQSGLDLDQVMADIAEARAGDVLLLHGCCHNPTGIDPDTEGWSALAEVCEQRGLIPLVDIAYQGFAAGLEEDAAGLRELAQRVPVVLVTASCSKNMGLYCERTGAAMVLGPNCASLAPVAGHLEGLTRGNYSMPPEHGAAIATLLFENHAAWAAELERMRCRLLSLRTQLAAELSDLGAPDRMQNLRWQRGMFSVLPFTPVQMDALRKQYGIYGTDGGRINVAGIAAAQIPRVAKALTSIAKSGDLSYV